MKEYIVSTKNAHTELNAIGEVVLYSYLTKIAVFNTNTGKLTLTNYWDYSITTLKHLKIFLKKYLYENLSKKEISAKIKSGEFIL